MIGICVACKKIKKLTKHHEKRIGDSVAVCDDCHKIIEAYKQFLEKIEEIED